MEFHFRNGNDVLSFHESRRGEGTVLSIFVTRNENSNEPLSDEPRYLFSEKKKRNSQKSCVLLLPKLEWAWACFEHATNDTPNWSKEHKI